MARGRRDRACARSRLPPAATRSPHAGSTEADLVIQGGIDKRALAGSREEIEREVLSKVPWLCLQGGYFPQIDHLVPPDVPLENYRHYAELIRAVVENPQRYLHEAKRIGAWPG